VELELNRCAIVAPVLDFGPAPPVELLDDRRAASVEDESGLAAPVEEELDEERLVAAVEDELDRGPAPPVEEDELDLGLGAPVEEEDDLGLGAPVDEEDDELDVRVPVEDELDFGPGAPVDEEDSFAAPVLDEDRLAPVELELLARPVLERPKPVELLELVRTLPVELLLLLLSGPLAPVDELLAAPVELKLALPVLLGMGPPFVERGFAVRQQYVSGKVGSSVKESCGTRLHATTRV
jgi:hypothetical protein